MKTEAGKKWLDRNYFPRVSRGNLWETGGNSTLFREHKELTDWSQRDNWFHNCLPPGRSMPRAQDEVPPSKSWDAPRSLSFAAPASIPLSPSQVQELPVNVLTSEYLLPCPSPVLLASSASINDLFPASTLTCSSTSSISHVLPAPPLSQVNLSPASLHCPRDKVPTPTVTHKSIQGFPISRPTGIQPHP